MAIVQNRVDEHTVRDRLAFEFHEAAEAARNGGQVDLARELDDQVEVIRLASELDQRH